MKSLRNKTTSRKLYDLPRWYDLAFADDPAHEAAIIERIFAAHSPHPVRRILEPACGSARLLIALSLYGYRLTGYDLSSAMIRFAQQRINSFNLQKRITVKQADMTTAAFPRRFDAAFNLISSIGHLLTDDALITHLRITAALLRPRSLYIVELPPLYRPGSVAQSNIWTVERDNLRITATWSVLRDDITARLSHQRCIMRIRDGRRRITHTENITVRLWLPGDWQRLIRRSACFHRLALLRSRGRSFHILQRL